MNLKGKQPIYTGRQIADKIVNMEKELLELRRALEELDGNPEYKAASSILEKFYNDKKEALNRICNREWTPLYEQQ